MFLFKFAFQHTAPSLQSAILQAFQTLRFIKRSTTGQTNRVLNTYQGRASSWLHQKSSGKYLVREHQEAEERGWPLGRRAGPTENTGPWGRYTPLDHSSVTPSQTELAVAPGQGGSLRDHSHSDASCPWGPGPIVVPQQHPPGTRAQRRTSEKCNLLVIRRTEKLMNNRNGSWCDSQLFSPPNTIKLNSQGFAMSFVYQTSNWKSLHKMYNMRN